MRQRNVLFPALGIGILAVLLLGSVAFNVYLYIKGEQYYQELNAVRLDPLGLNTYPPEPLPDDSKIVVFFGDSRAQDWPSPPIDDLTFVNRGIDAQTSAQVAGRFAEHVMPLHPDVIIVQVGINDLKTIPLFPEQEASIIANCQTHIRQIVTAGTDVGATVILTTIFPVGEVPLERRLFWNDRVASAIEKTNRYLASLASEHVVIMDTYSLLADESGKLRADYSVDMLHLNAAGYAVLNEALVKVLVGLDIED